MTTPVESIPKTSPLPASFVRRGRYLKITDMPERIAGAATDHELPQWEKIDLIYRTLCAILYNFVPTSGHPGGSISSGRFVEGLIYRHMAYDFADPDRPDNDLIPYAAGHKAMGLYAMWALRNELVRAGRSDLLAPVARQLRLEDLLGFRRNPTNETPLFAKYHSKALDGHPTCMVPFVKTATGASGVGVPSSFGLALGALDYFRPQPPYVHVIEGEGGMTPGRVHEAMAAAGTNGLANIIMHVDFNQASIDMNHVCRDETGPGDYVQWNPVELALFHDWNAIEVPNGHDFRQVLAAQAAALEMDNGQPTAVVYRTTKGWQYGIEGRASHGAGHKFASDEYYGIVRPFEQAFGVKIPRFEGDKTATRVEQTYWDTLMVVRNVIEGDSALTKSATDMIAAARDRLNQLKRKPRPDAPKRDEIFSTAKVNSAAPPENLQLKPGDSVTLRGVLGDTLGELNIRSGGAFIAAAADLSDSTSISKAAKAFPKGYFHAATNPDSRLIAIGGSCEDAMGAFMAGLSSFGHHVGASSSYGAFIAALEHIAARLHGIGQQAREAITGQPYDPWILVCAHAGVKTGEDGPTHADPQPLQLLQECFPGKVMVTLTPWDAREMWPLVVTALQQRAAVIAPFVTRPADKLVDWKEKGLPDIMATTKGVYALRYADKSKKSDGTIVLQGNGVATIFVTDVLPRIVEAGYNLNVFYISSVELFNLLDESEQESIFPEKLTFESMGITDFTLPTLYRWVRSSAGIKQTLHSFRRGHYLGSGNAAKVLEEAGIHADGQWAAIKAYVEGNRKK